MVKPFTKDFILTRLCSGRKHCLIGNRNKISKKETNTIDINRLANISIRGRVAFAICCLNMCITAFKLDKLDWELVLAQFWGFTSIQYLDNWQRQCIEHMPSSILEFENYLEDEYIYVSRDDFYRLRNLYSAVDKDVREVVDLICDVGISELYVGVERKGQSLRYLKQLIDIMLKYQLTFPDISQFEKYEFDKNYGWGEMFSKDEVTCSYTCEACFKDIEHLPVKQKSNCTFLRRLFN